MNPALVAFLSGCAVGLILIVIAFNIKVEDEE